MNGSELRRLRLAANMTQQELSRKVGINSTQISQYEKGVPIPHDAAVKFREAFEIPEDAHGRTWVPTFRTSSGCRFGYWED